MQESRPPSGAVPLERLRPYIPPWLARRLQPDLTTGPPDTLEATCQHLRGLLQNMTTYLPRQAVNEVLADPIPGRVQGNIVPGTVVMADITGFTALSEHIAHLGREGAEEITGIVNRYFTHMTDASDRECGFLVKFAGDAMILLFTGKAHAWRALRASVAMQEAMESFAHIETSQGTFSLQVKMGLGTGNIFTAHVGTTERMEYVMMGSPTRAMAQAEDIAQAGEIVLAETTYRALSSVVPTIAPRAGFYPLHHTDLKLPAATSTPVDPTPAPETAAPLSEPPLSQIEHLLRKIETIAPYLPYGLLGRLTVDPQQPELAGEHRLVTALFANVYEWEPIVSILAQRDPQAMTGILNRYFTSMHQIIHRYGGVVNKVDPSLNGHRLMALFGAPVAHEDDAERASLAALEMEAALEENNRALREAWERGGEDLGPFPDLLKQCIGINTGFVFAGKVGDSRRQEYSIMGDEVNLAARLMSVAGDGQVLISAATYRKIADQFSLHEQPAVRIKGKALPVQTYEVRGARSRPARRVRQTELIGRLSELDTLHKTLDQVTRGQGQMLAVTGDLGVGKTRLLEAMHTAAEQRGFSVISTSCLSYGQTVPYYPWSALLRTFLGLTEAGDLDERAASVQARLSMLDPAWDSWAPLLNPLLGLNLPENDLTRHLDGKARRQRLFDMILRLLQHTATDSPLMLSIDDLQWLDAASRDLIQHVARNVEAHRILIAVAYRTEPSTEEWADFAPCRRLVVTELPANDSVAMVASMLGSSAIPAPLQNLIVERTQGNPFFLEEIVHTLVESGAIYADERNRWQLSLDWESLDVPDTIHGMLISRIDRLQESDRRVLQVASVIGQTFPVGVLSGVYPYADERPELVNCLHQMSALGFTMLDRPEPEMAYAFKHSMIQEVTYESLPYARRRDLHGQVAEYVENSYAGVALERYDFLAHHYYLGRRWPKATEYASKAGQRAQEAYANEAAITYYERALELTRRYQATPATDEVSTAEALGDVYRLIGRYEQASDVYRSALAVDDLLPQRRADLHRKVALAHQFQAQYDAALAELERAEEGLVGERDPLALARIGNDRGWVFARQGRYEEAEAVCNHALQLLEQAPSGEDRQRTRTSVYDNLGSICRFTGEYDRSIGFLQDSLVLKEQLGDLQGVAIVYNRIAAIHWSRGDYETAADYMKRSLEIRERIGDRWGIATSYNNLGIVHYTQGQYELAEACYQQALTIWQEVGDTSYVAFAYVNLGELYFSDGKLDQAAWHLEQGERLLSSLGKQSLLFDANKWLAQVRLAQGRQDEALRHADTVLEIAKETANTESEGIARRILAQVLAATRDADWPAAEDHFRQSLEILGKTENALELGRAHYQFALALHRRQPDRDAEGQALLREAEAIFRRVGARRDLALAEAELAAIRFD